jgi:hypothetical protein
MDAGRPRAYRRVRMRRRHQPWRIVAICGVVGLLLAVTVLSGSAQGFVGLASVLAILFALVRALDSPDVQRNERLVARDEIGSGNYHSGAGTRLRDPSRASPPADE